MHVSPAMLVSLQALAVVPVRPDPLSVVEDKSLAGPVGNAYTLGKVDGRIALAKEILADLARGECTPGTVHGE